MAKRTKGKGIEAIFGDNFESLLAEIEGNPSNYKSYEIDINEIRANPYQPRTIFDEEKLKELSESIRIHGVFQPILIRKSINGYELVSGERRLKASKLAGKSSIPAIIVDFNDDAMMEISLLENIQRENLSPIEEASAFKSLIEKLNYSHDNLAKRLGKSRSYITNSLRLLKLPSKTLKYLEDKLLSQGHAKVLLSLDDNDKIDYLATKCIKEDISVRKLEELIKDLSKTKKISAKKPDAHLDYVRSLLENKFKTKVEIKKNKFTIKFKDTDDLNRILELIDCLQK